MPRPVSIKEETILEAARAVFLELGFRATTADVAKRAGISEGSIFKRYATKFDLFRAAMEERVDEPPWVRSLAGRVGQGDVEAHLVAVGGEILAFFREMMPLMMMSWSNPGPDGVPPMLAAPNPPPLRALQKLAGYFEAEMRLGRVTRGDAEIVARTFLGGLVHYTFTEAMFRSVGELPLPPDTFARGHARLVWDAIRPRTEKI